jgi:hypothetical protein
MKIKSELPTMVEAPCWRVSPADLCAFFYHLPTLEGDQDVLCMEGIGLAEIERLLQARPAIYENETDRGFLNLRSTILYTPVAEDTCSALAAICQNHAEMEVCSHLRVYRNDQIILSWHDLPVDPFYLAAEIDEDRLRQFCTALGNEYVWDATAA